MRARPGLGAHLAPHQSWPAGWPGHHVCGLPTMYGFPTMYLASPPCILIKGIRYQVWYQVSGIKYQVSSGIKWQSLNQVWTKFEPTLDQLWTNFGTCIQRMEREWNADSPTWNANGTPIPKNGTRMERRFPKMERRFKKSERRFQKGQQFITKLRSHQIPPNEGVNSTNQAWLIPGCSQDGVRNTTHLAGVLSC